MRWIVAALFIAVVSLGGTTMLYAAWHRSAYAGSYAIRICRGHCADPVEAPYLVGMLILFDRPVLDVHGHALRLDLERHPANGCFVLKQAPGQPGSYDGFPRQNYISWSLTQSRNAIDFELFRSPDAGYSVELTLAPKGLNGGGVFWGGAMGANTGPPLPRDVVMVNRVGEPDIKLCPPPSNH